jgi:formiminotetrahydrofolate cyclodeaminase
MNAAQAAALLAMTARYCDGPAHAGHAEAVGKVIAEADQLRHTCVALMAADGVAYGSVMAAYRLPKDTEERRAARSAAIADALVTAAGPPAEVIAAAARLLGLAQTLQPIVSRSTGHPEGAAEFARSP